jgi:hypothetical protein
MVHNARTNPAQRPSVAKNYLRLQTSAHLTTLRLSSPPHLIPHLITLATNFPGDIECPTTKWVADKVSAILAQTQPRHVTLSCPLCPAAAALLTETLPQMDECHPPSRPTIYKSRGRPSVPEMLKTRLAWRNPSLRTTPARQARSPSPLATAPR